MFLDYSLPAYDELTHVLRIKAQLDLKVFSFCAYSFSVQDQFMNKYNQQTNSLHLLLKITTLHDLQGSLVSTSEI